MMTSTCNTHLQREETPRARNGLALGWRTAALVLAVVALVVASAVSANFRRFRVSDLGGP
jgi:hypothetical protein